MIIPPMISFWVFFRIIIQVKFGITKTVLAVLAMVVPSFFLIELTNIEFLGDVVVFIVLVIYALKMNKEDILLCILYAFFPIIISVVSDNIGSSIINLVLHASESIIRNNMLTYYINCGLLLLFGCFLSFMVRYYLNTRFKKLNQPMQRKLLKYVMVGALMTLLIYMTNIYMPNYVNGYAVKDTVYTVLLIAYFIYMIFAMYAFVINFQHEMELSNKDILLQQFKTYTENMSITAEEMRKLRHDNVNMLLGLYKYLEEGDMKGALNYFLQYLKPFSDNIKADNASLDKLKNIKIPELNSILTVKLMHAQELGIRVHIEVYDEIDEIKFDKIDLCRIVGILLDNAVEACDGHDSAKIDFAVVKKDPEVRIIINNTISEPMQFSRIFEKGYTTKGDGHGRGLYILKQIIDKCRNAEIEIKEMDGYFVMVIIISNGEDG